MSGGWFNGRDAILLGEFWEHALLLEAVSDKAKDLSNEDPLLPSHWTDDDVNALALEILFSEAGLNGDLAFIGVGPDGRRVGIPSSYFNPSLRGPYTLHRGFNPDMNSITFVPLHDVQDGAFDEASRQSMEFPNLYHDWEEVEIIAEKLTLFLKEPSGSGAVPATAPAEGKRLGAKPKYHWPDFEAEADRKLEEEGGISVRVDPGPKGFSQAKLERHMAAWCQSAWGSEPSARSIRDYVRTAIEKYVVGRKGSN